MGYKFACTAHQNLPLYGEIKYRIQGLPECMERIYEHRFSAVPGNFPRDIQKLSISCFYPLTNNNDHRPKTKKWLDVACRLLNPSRMKRILILGVDKGMLHQPRSKDLSGALFR